MPEVYVYGAYVLPECGFVPRGNSIFSGWMVNGVRYSAGDTVIITEDTTITASWRRTNTPVIPYSISFRANGGSGTMDPVAVYGSKYVLPACQFTAPSSSGRVMVFAGWRVNDIQAALPAGTPIDIAGNTVLTAVWVEMQPFAYTVFFDANGGTGTYGPIPGVTSSYTLPQCYFTAPAGKQFKAWEAGGVQYAPGATIAVFSNTTVKAIWEDIYVVSFDANGGEGTMASKTMTKGEYTLPPCTFTAPEGMKFEAWNIGNRKYASGDKITVTSHTTVTALWKYDISISGTYTISGTSALAEVKVAGLPADPVAAALWVAQYQDGQLLAVHALTVAADGTFVPSAFTHTDGCTYQVFLLEDQHMPLCASVVLNRS